MKTLVTHINPHLDDISAIWLYKWSLRADALKKFLPEPEFSIEFIPASRDASLKEKNKDKIFFGTGGGEYDEHKGDVNDCATSLVWRDIVKKGLAPKNEAELQSLEELVEWNRLIDTGHGSSQDFGPYSIQSFIRTKDSNPETSLESLRLGEKILDRVLKLLMDDKNSEKDWQKKIDFKSSFGKSVAIESETVGRPFCREKSGDLFIIKNPKDKSVQFFTPSFEIDLEPIYKKLKEADSKADWFLHQSHHMILCGAGAQPIFTPTKLSLDELIKISKSV